MADSTGDEAAAVGQAGAHDPVLQALQQAEDAYRAQDAAWHGQQARMQESLAAERRVAERQRRRAECLDRALREIKRVLKPGGQIVYGVPVERPFMVAMFALLGYNIRKYHFSTEKDIAAAASKHFKPVRVSPMKSTPAIFGNVYEIGHFIKQG